MTIFGSPLTTMARACHDRARHVAPTIEVAGDCQSSIPCHVRGGYSTSHTASRYGRRWRSRPGSRSPLIAGSSAWDNGRASPGTDEDHPLADTAVRCRGRCRRREARAVTSNDESEQLRKLLAVTDSTLARLDVEDLLFELLERVRSVLDADTAAVLLRDGGSTSWWRERRAGWRRRFGRASGSRSAPDSPAASRNASARSYLIEWIRPPWRIRSCGRRASGRCSASRC